MYYQQIKTWDDGILDFLIAFMAAIILFSLIGGIILCISEKAFLVLIPCAGFFSGRVFDKGAQSWGFFTGMLAIICLITYSMP